VGEPIAASGRPTRETVEAATAATWSALHDLVKDAARTSGSWALRAVAHRALQRMAGGVTGCHACGQRRRRDRSGPSRRLTLAYSAPLTNGRRTRGSDGAVDHQEGVPRAAAPSRATTRSTPGPPNHAGCRYPSRSDPRDQGFQARGGPRRKGFERVFAFGGGPPP
jgi:hypothetical protein